MSRKKQDYGYDNFDDGADENEREKKGSAWRAVTAIILIIALAVFGFAAYNLYKIYTNYKVGTDEYDNLKQYVATTDSAASDAGTGFDVGEVDFASLQAVNPDVAAWIRFPNPDIIDYPVVYSSDNSYYLKHTFDGTANSSGAIFMDMNNKRDFSDPNVILYGHAMKNKSMFGSLKQFRDQEFCAENSYFFIYTPDGGVYQYQICAVYEAADTSDSYTVSFGTAGEYRNYLETIKSRSFFDTGAALSDTSRLVTLSTCTNVTESGRLLVQGVRVAVIRQASPAVPELSLPQ